MKYKRFNKYYVTLAKKVIRNLSTLQVKYGLTPDEINELHEAREFLNTYSDKVEERRNRNEFDGE